MSPLFLKKKRMANLLPLSNDERSFVERQHFQTKCVRLYGGNGGSTNTGGICTGKIFTLLSLFFLQLA